MLDALSTYYDFRLTFKQIINFLWGLCIVLLNGMIWAKFRFDYYARLESMMINFG
jgi:hypothetical protein